MHDPPYGSYGFAIDVTRNVQALFRRRDHRHQIGITALEVPEEDRAIAIEHVAAGAEITRRAAPDVRRPHAGDSGPIKPFPAIWREKTQPRRIALGNLQYRLGQGLKNSGRRVAQR